MSITTEKQELIKIPYVVAEHKNSISTFYLTFIDIDPVYQTGKLNVCGQPKYLMTITIKNLRFETHYCQTAVTF